MGALVSQALAQKNPVVGVDTAKNETDLEARFGFTETQELSPRSLDFGRKGHFGRRRLRARKHRFNTGCGRGLAVEKGITIRIPITVECGAERSGGCGCGRGRGVFARSDDLNSTTLNSTNILKTKVETTTSLY